MIVRSLDEIIDTERDVRPPGGRWESRRLLLKTDGMGFSMHDTIVHAGADIYIWYKNHLEAVYCIEGEGEIEDINNAETHRIKPGVLYALNGHENHYLRAHTDMRLVCVFNPALVGTELHGEDGSYPLLGEEP